MWLEQFVSFVEGALDGRGDVLEYVARENEIVGSVALGMGCGDVEIGLAVVESVGVIELLSETIRVVLLVAEPESLNGGQTGEFGEQESVPKQLYREHVHERSQT